MRHLGRRQLAEFRAVGAEMAGGRAGITSVLDTMFEMYSGPLFAAVVELSIAARGDESLRGVLGDVERAISREVRALGPELFGAPATPDFPRRLGMALSATRGTAGPARPSSRLRGAAVGAQPHRDHPAPRITGEVQ